MNARWLAPILIASSLLVFAAAPAAAQSIAGPVLVLGVQRSGKLDPRLTKSLHDGLLRAGILVARDNGLAPPERLCANDECMHQLLSREGTVGVLGVQLRDGGPGSGQYVSVKLFDSGRGATVESNTICDRCTPPQLVSAIVDTSKDLLRQTRESASAAPPPVTAPSADNSTAPASPMSGETQPQSQPGPAAAKPPITPTLVTTLPTEAPPPTGQSDYWSRIPRSRKIAAGVLAGALVAVLIPTIALLTTDGQDTTLLSCTSAAGFCKLQNKPLWAAGFGVSGALAVSIGLTLAWPIAKPAPSTSQPVQIPSLPEEAK